MEKLILFLIIFLINAGVMLSIQLPQPLVAYSSGGKWHFVNTLGTEIFAPKEVASVEGFSEGLFRVKLIENKKIVWAFMNMFGEIVFKLDCDYASNFSEGFSLIYKEKNDDENGKKFGYTDTKGNIVFDYIYDDATDFASGLAYVMNPTISGYINKAGEMVIPLKNKAGNIFREGLADVNTSDFKIGFFDLNGNQIIDFQYDETGGFSEGLANVNIKGKFGYIDKTGNLIIPAIYDNAGPFKEGLAFIGVLDEKFNTKFGLIDSTGKVIIDFKFDKVLDFSDGKAAVSFDGKWGFIGRDGKYVIQQKYNSADSYVDGLAWVSDRDAGKIGFINSEGEFKILIENADKIIDLRTNRTLFK